MPAMTAARMRSWCSGGKGRRVGGPAADDADGALELDPVGVDAGLGGGFADQGGYGPAGGRVARHQSAQLKKSGWAISTKSSSSRRYSLRASDCSPAPLPATAPIAASTTACEAHSLTVTTRTFGYAGRSASSAPAPEKPNAAAFSFVSGGVPLEAVDRHQPPRPQERRGGQLLRHPRRHLGEQLLHPLVPPS